MGNLVFSDQHLPLDRIVITSELERRTSRAPDYKTENQALRELARELAHSPQDILQKLVEKAAALCHADSAGISIAKTYEGKEIFHWGAVTGSLAPFFHATMPRDFAPCDVVLELLLVPFYQGDKPIGTIWIVSDNPKKKFDSEDSRILHSLAEFASAAVQTHQQTAVDVEATTKFEQTEARYRDAKEQLDLALASAQMGTWHLDLKTNKISLSDGTINVLGISYQNEEFLDVVNQIVHPEDREELLRVFQESIANNVPYAHEYRIIRPDGVTRWILARGTTRLDGEGRPVSISGIEADITQRKEDEGKLAFERHQLETIFQQSPAAMVLWTGPDFVFEKVNPGYQAIFPDRELQGRPFLEACPEFEGQPFQALLQKVLETGEPFVGREILARHSDYKDGPLQDHYYDFTYMRVTDAEGRPYGVYDHAMDVTARVLDRKKLEENQERLKQAIESRDTFLGIASHELKTPLTSLKLQSQMSRRMLETRGFAGFSPDRIQKLIDTTTTQAERLSRLVDDMLDVSRIASGKLSMNFEKTNFSNLIEDTLQRFALQLETVGCELQLSVEPNIFARVDVFRFEQVLTNMITNVIKYAPGKPIHIQLRGTASSHSNLAVLKVRDHGPGIPRDKLDRVFQRFERLISPNEVSGLGLGLYISKEIVDAHGGTIHLESELGQGAEFTVALPLVRN